MDKTKQNDIISEFAGKVRPYTEDVISMMEIEKKLSKEDQWHYSLVLKNICGNGYFEAINANSEKRAEALIRVLGLWR